jgi:hypothetical protein
MRRTSSAVQSAAAVPDFDALRRDFLVTFRPFDAT